jgi:hypothetical protein
MFNMQNEESQVLAVFFAGNIEKLMILMRTGFFEMKNGTITVHFNAEGGIRKIEKNNHFNLS